MSNHLEAILLTKIQIKIWSCINSRIRCHNAGLVVDQKAWTRDRYHTVDKAIRHKMSTISSADGHCQQRKLHK